MQLVNPLIVAVSGIRDIAPASEPRVGEAMNRLCVRATGFVFGGARGVDTLALRYAFHRFPFASRLVIVPGIVAQQPREAREAIERHASEVVEMRLDLNDHASFFARNGAMLDRAHALLAFRDGSGRGGTAGCIREAERRGLPVKRVLVERF